MITELAADFITTMSGMIIPPIFDLFKKKFISKDDSLEGTLNTIAINKPEVVGSYVDSCAALLKAKVDYFNRDVIGIPSKWVVNLRASITPITVIGSLGILILSCLSLYEINHEAQRFIEFIIAGWFGSRLTADD